MNGSDFPSRRHRRPISSSTKLFAYNLLSAAANTGAGAERRLMALIDAVTCVLVNDRSYGSEKTARLALETVVTPAVALTIVRTLTEST
jgi:hypothetical protein